MEACVVEVHNILQRLRRAVVKIGHPARETPQDRAFQPPDVFPQSGAEGATRIGGRLDFVRGLVWQSNYRKVAHVERAAEIAYSDVQRRRDGMVPHIGRIVARAARAKYRRQVQIIIQSRNSRDVDWLRIEQHLATDNTGAAVIPRRVGPCVKEAEDDGRKRSVARVPAKRVVDADKEGRCDLGREPDGPSGCAVFVKGARTVIDACAVERAISKSTISCCCCMVSGVAAWACPLVASRD